jgi:hypothetical protein
MENSKGKEKIIKLWDNLDTVMRSLYFAFYDGLFNFFFWGGGD